MMADPERQSADENESRRQVLWAAKPDAPPLPPGFADRLARRVPAARVRPRDPALAAAGISAACLFLVCGIALAVNPFPALNSLCAAAAAGNLALGPAAAVLVILSSGRKTHAQT
jgi:hypothetical protein